MADEMDLACFRALPDGLANDGAGELFYRIISRGIIMINYQETGLLQALSHLVHRAITPGQPVQQDNAIGGLGLEGTSDEKQEYYP
jgi:hypothetical protein